MHITFKPCEVLLSAWFFGRYSGQDGEENERTSEARREFSEPTKPGHETKFGSKGRNDSIILYCFAPEPQGVLLYDVFGAAFCLCARGFHLVILFITSVKSEIK